VNGLAYARLAPLSDTSETRLAERVAGPLFVAWGDGDISRPPAADLELTRLALAAEDAGIIAACGNGAMAALEGSPAPVRAAFGQQALRILQHAGIEAPWLLLSRAAAAAAEAGEGAVADRLLGEGMDALKRRRAAGGAVEPFEAGYLLFESGRRLLTRGELDRAVEVFKEVAALLGESGQDVSVAIARGQIADILHARGALDEALRIRTEEELPVLERLGDVREVAITKGKIADILQARGDLDEALRIRTEEQLPVLERLGDVRSVAVTKGQIADILQARGALDEALRIRTEEQLPVYERLEDLDGLAHVKFDIAQIRLRKGIETQEDGQAVLEDLAESFAINRKLGRADGIAAVGGLLGRLLAQLDLHDAARVVLGEAQAAYARLGRQDAAAEIGRLLDGLREESSPGSAGE
jgi:tetratricopeptide (TPR) repeat protein